ncbi:MAG: hypothetical protein ACYDEQ_12460, partial [Desulfocucumaceae bacterium]
MKIAFHFDADHERFDRYYGLPVVKEIFSLLLGKDTSSLHLKIFLGAICSLDYLRDKKNREELLRGLFTPPRPVWQSLRPDFIDYLHNRKIFVLAIEGISTRLKDYLHEALLNDETYLGAQQIHEANPVHWVLYSASLIPSYRLVGTNLRLFYSTGQGDEKDVGLAEDLKSFLPFSSVTFEEMEVHHTILDSYSSYEHASRIANLSSKLYDHLNLVADQLMLRLTGLDPGLYENMYSALTEFQDIETTEDLPRAALACRKMLESLADRLSPARIPKEESKSTRPDYAEKLRKYIADTDINKEVLLAQLQDIAGRSYKILDDAYRGNSQGDPGLAAGRMLIGLLIFINDIVSIAAPSPVPPS